MSHIKSTILKEIENEKIQNIVPTFLIDPILKNLNIKLSKKELEFFISTFDSDRTGKVGIEELVYNIEKLKNEKEAKDKLLNFETDISIQEFELLCQKLVPDLSTEDIHEMILDINQTEKETIDMKDFVNKIYDLN